MTTRFGPILIAAAAFVLMAASSEAIAQEKEIASPRFDPLEGQQADPRIPALKAVLGHNWCEDISNHSQIERYLQALAQADPERVKRIEYGRSWENRPLYLLILSAPENIRKLDQIRQRLGQLGDPRALDEDEANSLVESLPAVVWLAYGVHGDETSSPDAALATAYALLADRREEATERLKRLIVIIDPIQNPDGRERFVNAYRENRGAFPQAEPLANERGKRWAAGRFNHYWFDMNRDWLHQTQVESRAKVAAYLKSALCQKGRNAKG